jgi:hypothetical protein
MPGIKLTKPVGPGWTYSLDGNSWQDSPKFETQIGGAPFVEGTIYTIYCKTTVDGQDILRSVTIIFGEENSEPLFDEIVKRGKPSRKGWTDLIVKLMGGIITSLETTDDENLPTVVIDASGKLKRRGGKLLDYLILTGPASFPINQTGTFSTQAKYTDLSTAPALGAIYSVNSSDVSINALTGVLTPGPNAQVGMQITVTVTWQGKTASMVTTLTPASMAFTLRGSPRYFQSVAILGPDLDGSLDYANCYECGGWLADKNHPDQIQQGRIYINGIFAGLATATFARPTVSDVLGLTNTTGHIYGFKFAIPASYRTGQILTIELRPFSGTNAMRLSPKVVDAGCLDTSNLINVAAQKAATASSTETANLAWVPSSTTDENPDSLWISGCVGATEPVSLQVDLNGTAAPQEIKLKPRVDNQGAFPIDYQILGSLNGTQWFVMATVLNQVRTTDEILIPVEKNVDGIFRDVRYVKLVTSRNGTAGGGDCFRVQIADMKVMAPFLTPLGQQPPTRQPSRIVILGDSAVKENNFAEYDIFLFYTNGDEENVTSTATLSVEGTNVTFAKVGNKARLTAGDDGTTTPARNAKIKASIPGLAADRDITVWNATTEDYIVRYEIDWNTPQQVVTEGASNTVKVMSVMFSGARVAYTGPGSYAIIEPYPNGMTILTGANAIGTINLPLGSINADLSRVIRFNFPAGGGYVEKEIDLVNVPDNNPTFSGYEIVGDETIVESATAAVTKSYQLVEKYSDGSTRNYTGGGSYSVDTPYPPSMAYTTGSNGAGTVTLAANSITGNLSIVLRFTFPGNSTITKTIQLTNVDPPGCTPSSNAIDATVVAIPGGSTYNVDFFIRTLSGQPWKLAINSGSFFTMDPLVTGTDSNCYQFGIEIGPLTVGQTVSISISPDGSTGIVTRSVTVSGPAARTNLYSGT